MAEHLHSKAMDVDENRSGIPGISRPENEGSRVVHNHERGKPKRAPALEEASEQRRSHLFRFRAVNRNGFRQSLRNRRDRRPYRKLVRISGGISRHGHLQRGHRQSPGFHCWDCSSPLIDASSHGPQTMWLFLFPDPSSYSNPSHINRPPSHKASARHSFCKQKTPNKISVFCTKLSAQGRIRTFVAV